MCGIVGYAGRKQAAPVLLDGLSRLEYRGYDSAGICVHGRNALQTVKSKGRLAVLRELTGHGSKLTGTTGIGHTRWATHGAPSDLNSHPHLSASGKISVVHNGIIENEANLRKMLEKYGVRFQSETDTEVVANLIGRNYDGCHDFRESVRQAISMLQGSFALAILCEDAPNTIVAVKKDSPLVFGFGEKENCIASDLTAIAQYAREITDLEDGEMVVFTGEQAEFYDADGKKIEKTCRSVTWQPETVSKGPYDHFMLKEIYEQPKAVRDTVMPRIRDNGIFFENLELTEEYLLGLKKIYFIGCGSAYYVGLLAKYAIEKACRIPVEAVLASEFRYSEPVADETALVIAISQSGETADTLAALREAKRRNAKTVAIVNAAGSAMAKEADHVIRTYAGPEIAVATTKAFSAQLAAVHLLTVYLSDALGRIGKEERKALIDGISQLPEGIDEVLRPDNLKKIRLLAEQYCGRRHAFYVGRNTDSAICLEGSLKLKEVAYLHSEAYPAGELKHGPISMIERGTLVIALTTVDSLFDKTMANIREVKSRGAEVLCLTLGNRQEEAAEISDHVITVPAVLPALQPSLSMIPLQVFAYYVAVYRGCDVDKPRNLAKSVTVE